MKSHFRNPKIKPRTPRKPTAKEVEAQRMARLRNLYLAVTFLGSTMIWLVYDKATGRSLGWYNPASGKAKIKADERFFHCDGAMIDAFAEHVLQMKNR